MRAVGIILAGGNSNKMRELTHKRAVAAMPIAGSYRAIDFALSNMSNSHIQKVAVLTQYNARSLNEHLNSSKWWNFGRKQGGLYVFTPTITNDNGYWYRGTADAIYQNMDFLKKDIRDHFINEYPYIETKPKDEPPAKYNRGADVTDSIVGSGAIFDGKVEHSVVFRRVRVGKGAVVRNSILMEGCQIGENCVVENAIFDKEVVLSAGQRVIGVSSEEPAVLKKGTKL